MVSELSGVKLFEGGLTVVMISHKIKLCLASAMAVILTIVFLGTRFALSSTAYTFTPDVTLHSQVAILYSVDTEQIIYEKNADMPEQIGHLAQIMTAIVVLEACDDIDVTSLTADGSLYSVLYSYDVDDVRYGNIYDGDVLTVREYLYALLLTSSCEAALILADYFGGGVDGFVTMMNEKAAELGCTETTFVNPTGLYDRRQTTTARDLLTITNYAMENEDFASIATTVEYTPKISTPENHRGDEAWVWTHANSMMLEDSEYYYPEAMGIKTGNISACGRSIITEATLDNGTFMVILLNAPFTDSNDKLQFYHLEDAAALFDWASESLSYTTILGDDQELAEVAVENSDGNSYVLVRPETDCILLWCDDVDSSAVQRVIELDDDVQAPVKAGDELGTVTLKFSGEEIASVPLVAISDVGRSFWRYNLYALENFHHSPWLRNGIIAGCVLTVLYIILCIIASVRAKRAAAIPDPIRLNPHTSGYRGKPRQGVHRSDTVFYHGPDGKEQQDMPSDNTPPPDKRSMQHREDKTRGSHS